MVLWGFKWSIFFRPATTASGSPSRTCWIFATVAHLKQSTAAGAAKQPIGIRTTNWSVKCIAKMRISFQHLKGYFRLIFNWKIFSLKCFVVLSLRNALYLRKHLGVLFSFIRKLHPLSFKTFVISALDPPLQIPQLQMFASQFSKYTAQTSVEHCSLWNILRRLGNRDQSFF